LQSTVLTPERLYWTGNLVPGPCVIGIVRAVDRCRGSIFFTDCVDMRGVVKCIHVRGPDCGRKRIDRRPPFAYGVVDNSVRCATEKALWQRCRLG